jgi:hypothetical protein
MYVEICKLINDRACGNVRDDVFSVHPTFKEHLIRMVYLLLL